MKEKELKAKHELKSCEKCLSYEEKYMGNECALSTYYDVVKTEYEYAINKRNSFYTRSGFIVTINAAMTVFFKNENYINILKNIDKPLTIGNMFIYLLMISIFVGYVLSIIFIIKTLSIQNTKRFDVSKFDDDELMKEDKKQKMKIVNTYRDIVEVINCAADKQAKAFQKSLIITFITLFLMIIFILGG